MKPILSSLLVFFITTTILGQAPKNKSVAIKIKQLKTLLRKSDTLSPEMTDSLEINYKISTQLSKILVTPGIEKYDLQKEFKETGIGTTHSKDNRLWFFTWYENTGGSFKSNLTVIQYKTKTNKVGVIPDSDFDSSGASYDQIIKLPSKNKNLYLCLGYVIGCNSCFARVATVIELTATNINLDYPAFENAEETNYAGETLPKWIPTFIMDSRADDIKTFEYDVKTQSISYSYVPDDNTPTTVGDDAYNPDAKPIEGNFKWNGTRFIGSTAGRHVK